MWASGTSLEDSTEGQQPLHPQGRRTGGQHRQNGAAGAMQAGEWGGRSLGPGAKRAELRGQSKRRVRWTQGCAWSLGGSRLSSRGSGGPELGLLHARSCGAERSCPWGWGAQAAPFQWDLPAE